MAVGASCTVNVSFLPNSSTPITKSQLLNVNVAGSAISQSIPLTGNVILPTYSIPSTTLAFGNQARNTTSAAQTVTLNNTGTVALTLTNIAVGGTNANQFATTNTCTTNRFRPFPATLAAGASCTMSVTFRPTSTGAKSASLSVSVGGGAAPAQTQISLSGTGQ